MIAPAFAGGASLTTAARTLGATDAALRSLCRTHDIDFHELQRADSVPPVVVQAIKPAPAPEEQDAPAWQGYRPRAVWTPPDTARIAKPRDEKVTRTIVIADCHVPFHSRPAWACALGIIRDAKPDRVVINGDFMEMEALSKHPKSRPDLARLAEELYAGNLALDELQAAAGSAEIVYLEGNHEGRAPRFAAELGQLDGMLSIPAGLYLEPRTDYARETSQLRGIRWVPLKDQPFALGGVGYLHGVFESMYHAAMTAMHLGPKCGIWHLISAHMHGWQSFASPSGFVAYACPWLGDEKAHTIRAYVKGRPKAWHLGVLDVQEAGTSVNVSPVFIRNGRALYGGRVVAAA